VFVDSRYFAFCLKPVFFRMAIYSAAHLIQFVSASAHVLLIMIHCLHRGLDGGFA
jgi:hypothetical protein